MLAFISEKVYSNKNKDFIKYFDIVVFVVDVDIAMILNWCK